MRLRCMIIGLTAALLLIQSVFAAGSGPDEVIGVSGGAMSPRRTSVSYGARVTETALGDLAADAFRVRSGAAVAVECGGHLTQSLPGGEITRRAVSAIFAQDLEVGVAEIPIPVFFEILEQAVSGTAIDEAERIDPESGSDAFPQISGFQFIYDVSQPAGERVRSVTLDDGTELRASDAGTLSLAAPVDLLGGELGFGMLRGTAYSVVGTEAELVSAYIESQSGEIQRPTIGRIQAVGSSDSSLYGTLHIGRYLPYLILLSLLIMLPLQRRWEREPEEFRRGFPIRRGRR